MIDYLSNLPIELIEKILDDVPSFDVLTSLSCKQASSYVIS